jgi:hypothetical protein
MCQKQELWLAEPRLGAITVDNTPVKTPPAAILGAFCATAVLSAVQMTLDPRAVSEALAIGQSGVEKDRRTFHAPYRIQVNTAPIDFIDVVTPFRRVALHAEARARIGDRSFGQRQAFDLLDAAPAELEIWVDLTFHPQHTYVGVPAYDVFLIDRTGLRVAPRTFDRVPRFGARVEGEPLRIPVPGGIAKRGVSETMLGGTVMAQFDGRLLNATGTYDVVVSEEKRELTRVRVELGKLR